MLFTSLRQGQDFVGQEDVWEAIFRNIELLQMELAPQFAEMHDSDRI